MTHFNDIDSTQISLGKPARQKVGSFGYTSVPILCSGKPLFMRASGKMEIHTRTFEQGKDTFSISLDIERNDLQAFLDIESKIQEETGGLEGNPTLPKFKRGEFKFIRKYDYDDLAKIWSKLYTTNDGKISARFFEKVIHESGAKKRVIPDPREMVGVPFDGEIIIQLQRMHFGSVKTITAVAKEVLVKDFAKPESFFDDLSDDEIDDTQGFDTIN